MIKTMCIGERKNRSNRTEQQAYTQTQKTQWVFVKCPWTKEQKQFKRAKIQQVMIEQLDTCVQKLKIDTNIYPPEDFTQNGSQTSI